MMKNKIKLKKFLLGIAIIICILLSRFLSMKVLEYNSYNKNFNYKITSIINKVEEKYPEVSEEELLEILNNETYDDKIFEKYSIDINSDTIIKDNEKLFYIFLMLDVLFYIFTISLMLYYFLKFNKNKDKEISKITKCIEEINKNNYSLDLDEISEDELSILKNEIYKTTIILKEATDNSNKEKLELKDYLSDISHQLKTPLASIQIMLDNLSSDPNMDANIREDFIKDIKREIANINFLVQALLKLSKLDTNTIDFIRKDVYAKTIIEEASRNLSPLADLKNVKIKIDAMEDAIIRCDFKWQLEAITNIVKNCIEYAKENTSVDIEITDNKIYTQIIISDTGKEIEEGDMNHIFERFYKCKNSNSDGIGIGLSLAKTIINKDNGIVSAEKIKNGTRFIIKYYK